MSTAPQAQQQNARAHRHTHTHRRTKHRRNYAGAHTSQRSCGLLCTGERTARTVADGGFPANVRACFADDGPSRRQERHDGTTRRRRPEQRSFRCACCWGPHWCVCVLVFCVKVCDDVCACFSASFRVWKAAERARADHMVAGKPPMECGSIWTRLYTCAPCAVCTVRSYQSYGAQLMVVVHMLAATVAVYPRTW